MIKFKKWTSVTKADIKRYLVDSQFQNLIDWTFNEAAKNELDYIIEDIIRYIRCIFSHFATLDENDALIPEDCFLHCIYLIIEILHARVPGLELSELQKKKTKQAQDYFDALTYFNLRMDEKRKYPHLVKDFQDEHIYEKLYGFCSKTKNVKIVNDQLYFF